MKKNSAGLLMGLAAAFGAGVKRAPYMPLTDAAKKMGSHPVANRENQRQKRKRAKWGRGIQ